VGADRCSVRSVRFLLVPDYSPQVGIPSGMARFTKLRAAAGRDQAEYRGGSGDNFSPRADVASDRVANLYVPDGYGNARAAHRRRDGNSATGDGGEHAVSRSNRAGTAAALGFICLPAALFYRFLPGSWTFRKVFVASRGV
jgi:hypothetical protein